MTDMILWIAALLSWGCYTGLKTKKSIHMLQLNSYRNERYHKWMSQNAARVMPGKEWIAWGLVVLAVLPIPSLAASAAAAALFLLFYITNKKEPEKKKLAVTNRVKRLILTTTVLYLLLLSAWYMLSQLIDIEAARYVGLIVLLQIAYLVVYAANWLNAPWERSINNYYFADAKRILKAMDALKVIGITGSFGKTSVKHIVHTILSSTYNVLMTPESYNTPLGVTKTVRGMLRPFHEVFIAEMGAKQKGDIKEICDLVQPEWGILTAIGEQHLDTFGSLATVQKTKYELIQSLPANGIGFMNCDDENIMSFEGAYDARAVYYGIDSDKAHYRATDFSYDANGSTFTVVKYDGSSARFTTKLLGKHNIYNVLAGIAVGSELGIPLEAMQGAVAKLQAIKHRLELKRRPGGVTVIDDSFNSNPTGSRMALDVLSRMQGKRILVTPGMIELGDKEYEYNKEFGRLAAASCDYVVLVGAKQTEPIQAGLKEAGYPPQQLFVAKHFNEAVQHLNTIAGSGSVILFENDLPDTYNE